MINIILIAIIGVLFIISYFLFKYLRGKFSKIKCIDY